MDSSIVKYRDWVFAVEKKVTAETYAEILSSGADTCPCNNCKNYTVFRDKVFPEEVLILFKELGVDFRKEVEIVDWETLSNGLHNISGWFHFKGEILGGKDCRNYYQSGGYTLELTPITDNFSIGFSEGNDLTFFKENAGLVQLEFNTRIPWVIHKSLENV